MKITGEMNMEIIELFGLPGSGKTKNTVNLYNDLTKRGYKCVLIRPNEYENLPYLRHTRYIFGLLNPKYFFTVCFFLGSNICLKNKYFYSGNGIERIKILLRQIMYLEIYLDKTLDDEVDVLISDQGLVQELTGIFLEKKTYLNWIIYFTKKLNKSRNDIKFRMIDSKITSALANIKLRDRNSSPMDAYDPYKLERYLYAYSDAFETILKYYKNDSRFC